MPRIKNVFILAILGTFILNSCNLGTTRTWKDQSIDERLKSEIRTLDKIVLHAVLANNVDLLKSIMSEELLEVSKENIEQLMQQARSIVKNTDYEILNQFHVKNSAKGIGNTTISGVSGLNDYTIQYQALNKEMFISLLIPKTNLDEYLVANIYGKYPDGWRLNILQFGQYKVNGLTSPELYLQAKEKYEKGYILDAANDMFLSSSVNNPANNLWKYQKEDEIKEFNDKVMTEIKAEYEFPMILNAIDSKPQLFAIYPKGTKDGYFPMIEYLTELDLKDTIQMKAEYEAIHNEVVKMFKGIEKDKDYIFYKAYSEMPNGKTSVPTYGFVKRMD